MQPFNLTVILPVECLRAMMGQSQENKSKPLWTQVWVLNWEDLGLSPLMLMVRITGFLPRWIKISNPVLLSFSCLCFNFTLWPQWKCGFLVKELEIDDLRFVLTNLDYWLLSGHTWNAEPWLYQTTGSSYKCLDFVNSTKWCFGTNKSNSDCISNFSESDPD